MRSHCCIGDTVRAVSTLGWSVPTSLHCLEETLGTGWGLAPDNRTGWLETQRRRSAEARQAGLRIPSRRDAFLFYQYTRRPRGWTTEAGVGYRNSKIAPGVSDSGFERGCRSRPALAAWTTRPYYPRLVGFQTE